VNSPKNYLLVILACTTLGGAAYAWKQYQELIALRAAALGSDERSDLQKRLWAAEKRGKDLADQLAAARSRIGSDEALAENGEPANPAAAGRGDRRTRGPGGPGGFGNVLNALQKPETQRLIALQQKAQLDSRYAALFKGLNLSPAQLEKFKNLLVERQTSMMDVMTAAREQGVDPRADPQGFRQLVAGTQAESDASIKTALGDTAYAQYKDFEKTMPPRATTDQLGQRLSYTSTPLTAEQSASMVTILAQTAPATRQPGAAGSTGGTATVSVVADSGGGRGGPGGSVIGGMFGALGGVGGQGGGTTANSPITDATVNLAQGVLSGPQVDALKQLQQEQLAQQKLGQTFRETMGGGTTPTTPATPATGKKKGG